MNLVLDYIFKIQVNYDGNNRGLSYTYVLYIYMEQLNLNMHTILVTGMYMTE